MRNPFTQEEREMIATSVKIIKVVLKRYTNECEPFDMIDIIGAKADEIIDTLK